MKRVLVDSKDNIVYEGADAKDVLQVLLKSPEEVTEEDEVRYEDQLRNISWIGKLRFEAQISVRFEGLDDWNRPVFKDIDSIARFGSTSKLYGWEEWQKNGLKFFKENPNALEYFGTEFDCEPNGGTSEFWKFNIID